MSEYQKENKILFNRKKLRRSRVRAMNYDIPNFIYEHTAQDLTSRLDEINREFKSILILTKNKNFISTKSLTKKIKDPLIVSPISLSNKKAIMIEDEEYLPFQENSFDLILSDLMLHASNNLKSSLEKIHALLKPDGLMLCSMFGSETLRELRSCLLAAEEQFKERYTHVYTHLLISEQRVISCKAQDSNFVLRMTQQLRFPRKMFINW